MTPHAKLTVLKWLIRSVLALLVLVMIVLPSLVWGLLHTESFTRALLPHLPGVRVFEPQGALLGDFRARRVEIDLPRGSLLSLDDASWQHLSVHFDSQASWRVGLHARQLSARLVQIKWVPNPHPTPTTDPYDLRLPLSVTVDRVQAQRGDSVLWGPWPLRDLDGRLELGQAAHRADVKNVVYGPWTLKGTGQVQTVGKLRGDLNIAAGGVYPHDGLSWPVQAQVKAGGRLTELSVQGQVQVGAGQAAQSLDVAGVLKLWAPWPLPGLHVKARQFDLAALDKQLPQTTLSGSLDWAAQGVDMQARVDLRNDLAGDWVQHRLPMARLQGRASLLDAARATSLDDWVRAVQVHLLAEVPGGRQAQIRLDGSWDRRVTVSPTQVVPTPKPVTPRWPNRLMLSLQDVHLRALDGRAPDLTLSGDTTVTPDRLPGKADDLTQAWWTIVSDLNGTYPFKRQSQAVQATLRGQWQPGKVKVESLVLKAEGAQASLTAQGAYRAPTQPAALWTWTTQGQLKVQGFDPKVWLPWPDALMGANRLQGQLEFDLASTWLGRAALQLEPSTLAGTSVQGQAHWQALPGKAQAHLDADLTAAGNRLQGEGTLPWRLGPDGLPRVKGNQIWSIDLQAPALRALQTLASAWGVRGLSGEANAQARFTGQWPAIASAGQLQARQVHWQWDGQTPSELDAAQASWGVQTLAWDAPMQWQASLSGLKLPHVVLDQATWTLSGTGRDHQSVLRMQGKPVSASAGKAGSKPPEPMVVTLSLHGGLQQHKQSISGWQGHVQDLNWQSAVDEHRVWLRAQPFDLAWRRVGALDQVSVSPTSLSVMGAAMSLKELNWQGGEADPAGQVRAWLQLEPLNLSALLKQWQPQAGWGGDLTMGGQVRVQHSAAQPWQVQAQVAKLSGDLSLSEAGIAGQSQQKLGIDVAALNLNARDGVWTLTEQFEGSVLGRLTGRQSVKTARQQNLPGPSDLLAGDLDVQIGNLRPWATWLPAGWRLSGQLKGRAELMGTLGAPQYRGTLNGQNLRLAHALLGVNLTDGQLALDLQGDHARLTDLTAKGGPQGGTVRATGEAVLGVAPQASVSLQAERFALFQRIDRRVTLSGQANAVLTESDIQLNGKLKVDEGLFDLSRLDAPTVGDDVNVLNGPGQTPVSDDTATSGSGAKRKMVAAVDVDLGDHLHLRGRGLDTDLTGNLKFTTPNNRPSLQGTVKAARGTYVAYGQKLDIERGAIVFTGPVENPRLDILAMRRQSPMAASSDVKVGVQIAGTAQDPRISLYSDPSMSETDKLSWLILGRGPSGLGGADIGLLQSAAVALLSGEGPSTTDNLMSTLGLDELSLHQSDGTVRDTVVNVGKQLSKYWYLGYERNLNATSGNWQLIYRLAQRFTLRAQTGADNAVDLIWGWRWD